MPTRPTELSGNATTGRVPGWFLEHILSRFSGAFLGPQRGHKNRDRSSELFHKAGPPGELKNAAGFLFNFSLAVGALVALRCSHRGRGGGTWSRKL